MASSQPHYELFGPEEVPLSERTQDADYPLAAFKSFLYNQSDDRQTLSNAIVFWDLLPKYANEKLNQLPKNEFPVFLFVLGATLYADAVPWHDKGLQR